MDQNTREAAGKRVEALLDGAGISYCAFVFPTKEPIEPTEESVGKVMMAWDPSCDIILAIGSGVINDISKFVSRVSGHPYLLVLTAPSMDGIVSPSSSMSVVGLKVSLPSAVVHTVVGDLGVLSHAPERMILSGYGDMLAKYISTLEWRISNLINGEYYCPEIDGMMQEALKRVGKSADGLISRDMRSVREETDGLVLAGCAMAYAGVTRPASGMEHYISHVMDMRHLAFGTPADFHGIQVGVATLVSLRVYEELEKIESVDVEEALRYVRDFNVDDWFRTLRGFIGPAAEGMIAVEAHDHKYDKASHGKRIVRIAELWPDLRKLMVDRLPSSTVLEAQMKKLGMPTSLTELGVKKSEIPVMIKCTKDIRDKYVGTRLLWDLGLLDEVVETVTARSV
jgi:glycerol-1-phosphate dehydrogenase [NAD(P)+]